MSRKVAGERPAPTPAADRREGPIPYGHQSISEDDIAAVASVLRSDWITQGPAVERFEQSVCRYTGAKYAVAVANGTAALHLLYLAAGLKAGDELITSPLTFAATANAALYCGAKPVFADIDPSTLNIDCKAVEKKITKKTKAIAPVHFAGLPADLAPLRELAQKHGLLLLEDAAHALGAVYQGEKIGASGHSILSFHPVKHITTGEGGMVLTEDADIAKQCRLLRTHGISRDVPNPYGAEAGWYYDMTSLGFNYRITDIQCALGASQMQRLDSFLAARRRIAKRYDEELGTLDQLEVPAVPRGLEHAYHLYPLRLNLDQLSCNRDQFFSQLRSSGILANVHYQPVYRLSYYQKLGYKAGLCPQTEKQFERLISIPIFPDLKEEDQTHVIEQIGRLCKKYARS